MVAIDHNRASTALFKPTTKLRTDQIKLVAQNVNQWRLWVAIDLMRLAIHLKRNFRHHALFDPLFVFTFNQETTGNYRHKKHQSGNEKTFAKTEHRGLTINRLTELL